MSLACGAAALGGCLPEGPPGLGELVLASDGAQEALLADGPFETTTPLARRPLLVHGRLDEADAAPYPSLYLFDGTAPRRLGRDVELLAQPWGQDGSYWFTVDASCALASPSADCASASLQRLGSDGQSAPALSGGRLQLFERVGPWTSAEASNGQSFVRRDDGAAITARGRIVPVGEWYFAQSAADARTLLRFSDDEPTPRIVASQVSNWFVLPVAPRPHGWLVVESDAGDALVDPDSLEMQPLPLDRATFTDVRVRPDGNMLVSFKTFGSGRPGSLTWVTFIDPLTWETQGPPAPFGGGALDTWRAIWRPGSDEVWVGTNVSTNSDAMARSLYAVSPARSPVVVGAFDVSASKTSADANNVSLLSHGDRFAPFFGFGTGLSSDGLELLVTDEHDEDAWLNIGAPDTPLRAVVPSSLQANWVIEAATPGSAWALSTSSGETSLWFSARALETGAPPRLDQMARSVSLVWVGATRALAIVRSIGDDQNGQSSPFGPTAHGDLVLLDPQGGETWIASNVISFTPVPPCASCDALATGSRLIYVVNASRPWHRNGVWECILP